MLPKIRLFCDISPGTGHNNATRGLVQTLEVLGYDPSTLKVVGAVSCSMDYQSGLEHDWLRKYIYSSWPEQEQINLVHLNPCLCSEFWTAGRRNIAYCAWETDALPKAVHDICYGAERGTAAYALNKFEQVWVPTEFLVGIFKSSGVTVPIHVVPHALQRELLERPVKPLGKKPVGFYSIGSWNARKDLEGLFRAYLQSGWSMNSPVSLDIHAVPHNRDAQSVMGHQIVAHEAVKGLVAACSSAMPRFGLHTKPMNYSGVLDFHEQHQVFVTLSHGEGFGLPMLEALAMGRVAIGGGPWVDDLRARLGDVDFVLRSLPYESVPITPMPDVSGYELDQNWWSVNRKSLVTAMKLAYDDVARGITAATCSAAVVRKAFSPSAVAEIVKPLLKPESYTVRPAKEGEVQAYIHKWVASLPDSSWVPVDKTLKDWTRDVRQAANNDDVYVLGTSTLLWFENDDVYVMGQLGHAYVGKMVDGKLCHTYDAAKDHQDLPTCVVRAYRDDPRETIRGPHGEAEMTEEAKADCDNF